MNEFGFEELKRKVQSISVSAWRTTSLTVPNNDIIEVPFTETLWHRGTLWVIGEPTRLTAPKAGVYSMTAYAQIQANDTGRRETNIRLNGTTVIAEMTRDNLGASILIRISLTTEHVMDAGDYVEMRVYQNSGGDLTIRGDLDPYRCRFTMTKIA